MLLVVGRASEARVAQEARRRGEVGEEDTATMVVPAAWGCPAGGGKGSHPASLKEGGTAWWKLLIYDIVGTSPPLQLGLVGPWSFAVW